MNPKEIFISRFSAWAPGVENSNEWEEWALGKREITIGPKSPDILFTEPMFRRRLSQISKMTIQVVHDLLPVAENTKMLFFSFRGELLHQYKINKTFIEDNDIMPAGFSLSVFNAPAALASIAFGLKGGYSAIFPGENSFRAALSLTEAAFIGRGEPRPQGSLGAGCGESEELIFVYADEDIPQEYKNIFPGNHLPLAFGFVLTHKPEIPGSTPSIHFSALKEEIDYPEDFLKRLILSKLS